METYTIAQAARLLDVPRSKLYQAIRAGRLHTLPTTETTLAQTVTAAALQEAGFAVPGRTPSPSETVPPAEPVAAAPMATPGVEAATAPTPTPAAETLPSASPEQRLLAHLEQALAQAYAREQRLLELLAQLTPPRPAPEEAAPAAVPAPVPTLPPPARVAPPQPLSGVRQHIVAVLQEHPEGLAPKAVQTLLHGEKDLRSTMKGMVRSGVLTRLAAGRYVVADATPAG